MSLCELIDKFECGEVTDVDLDHPLTGNVAEELAQCRENERQRKLFNDARQLADHIIERYLILDQTDKAKMAAVYASEKCFAKIGGLKVATKRKLQKILGKDNLGLLLHISNYCKIMSVLWKYVYYVDNADHITPRYASLGFYLRSHNWHGDSVKSESGESLGSVCQYDFAKNKKFSDQKNEERILESLLLGIPADLRKYVLSVRSLIPTRRRILRSYLTYIEESPLLTLRTYRLGFYLRNYNLKGERVKQTSGDSLKSFAQFDFVANQTFLTSKKRVSNENIVASMLFGVDDDELVAKVKKYNGGNHEFV